MRNFHSALGEWEAEHITPHTYRIREQTCTSINMVEKKIDIQPENMRCTRSTVCKNGARTISRENATEADLFRRGTRWRISNNWDIFMAATSKLLNLPATKDNRYIAKPIYSKLLTQLCHAIKWDVFMVVISYPTICGESNDHEGENISWDVSMNCFSKLADTCGEVLPVDYRNE